MHLSPTLAADTLVHIKVSVPSLRLGRCTDSGTLLDLWQEIYILDAHILYQKNCCVVEDIQGENIHKYQAQ